MLGKGTNPEHLNGLKKHLIGSMFVAFLEREMINLRILTHSSSCLHISLIFPAPSSDDISLYNGQHSYTLHLM